MLNNKEFQQIKKELELRDLQRDELIKKSRDVITLSKKIIYSMHRNNLKDAEKFVRLIKKELDKLTEMVEKDPKLDIGSYKNAVQEYVESVAYFHFMQGKKIPTKKELDVGSEYYLMGLCDLTGELVRSAFHLGIEKKTKKVEKIREFVKELQDELSLFDFRNSELRKKFDSIKYNLKKLDELVFDLKVRK